MSDAAIFWSILFGAIGLAYFVYGKKQRAPVPLVCGLVLMLDPYLLTDAIALVVVNLLVCAVPYFVRI